MHSTGNTATDPQAGAATLAAPAAGLPSPVACAFCNTRLAGRYCHACGEDSLPVETTWQGWLTQWHRLMRTLRTLLLEPGRLAEYHLAGSRIRYIPPMTLFLNAVAVTFLFGALTEFRVASFVKAAGNELEPLIARRAEKLGVSRDVVIERAERRFQGTYTLSLCVVSGLGYTLLYRLLYRRRLQNWRAAFTMALNYLAWLFVFFLPFLLLNPPIARTFGTPGVLVFFGVGLLIALAWQTLAARRIGLHRWPVAVAKGVAFVTAGYFLDTFMTGIAVARAHGGAGWCRRRPPD